MKGLDGIQGPVYVGTGCVFFRQALYGYSPQSSAIDCKILSNPVTEISTKFSPSNAGSNHREHSSPSFEKTFGLCPAFIESTLKKSGGVPNLPDPSILIREVIHVIRCGYEAKTRWGKEVSTSKLFLLQLNF